MTITYQPTLKVENVCWW